MSDLSDKVFAAVQASGSVEHEALVETLNYNERQHLLNTVREMQKNGLIKRDVSERRDGHIVLKYRLPRAGE